MTGTIRFGIKTLLRASALLMCCALATFVVGPTAVRGQSATGQSANGQPSTGTTGRTVPAETSSARRVSTRRFSAALADDLPPAQYGTYQYLGSPPQSQHNHGFQFTSPQAAGTGAERTPGKHPLSTPVEHSIGLSAKQPPGKPAPMAWGHTDLQQVQYPLMDATPDELDKQDRRATTRRSEPHFMAPIVTAPAESLSTPSGGLNLQTQFLGDATYVIGSGNSLGITTLTARAVVETPRLPGVSLRPHFGWHFLNGPRRTDLPSQLYDASVEARMYWPFSERIIGEFALAPGVYSDFDNTSGDALRIVGRAVGYYRWSPDLRLAAGGTYLDREDVRALPIVGVIWTPTPDDKLTLLFPQPRIAHRYRKDADHERWVYLSGEFGGGSWAIQRASGRDDIVSYRDWRLITGIEFKFTDKTSWRIEGGYVFSRELEYVSNIGNYQLGDTSMVRAAFVY